MMAVFVRAVMAVMVGGIVGNGSFVVTSDGFGFGRRGIRCSKWWLEVVFVKVWKRFYGGFCFGIRDLLGCWVVSGDGDGDGDGYGVVVVVVLKCYSGGCGGMLVVDQCPHVVMVEVCWSQSIEFL